jgi:hypothetical protein
MDLVDPCARALSTKQKIKERSWLEKGNVIEKKAIENEKAQREEGAVFFTHISHTHINNENR